MKTLQKIDDRHYKLMSEPREFRGNQYVKVETKKEVKIPKIRLTLLVIIMLAIGIFKIMQVVDENTKPIKHIISPLPKELTLIK